MVCNYTYKSIEFPDRKIGIVLLHNPACEEPIAVNADRIILSELTEGIELWRKEDQRLRHPAGDLAEKYIEKTEIKLPEDVHART